MADVTLPVLYLIAAIVAVGIFLSITAYQRRRARRSLISCYTCGHALKDCHIYHTVLRTIRANDAVIEPCAVPEVAQIMGQRCRTYARSEYQLRMDYGH